MVVPPETAKFEKPDTKTVTTNKTRKRKTLIMHLLSCIAVTIRKPLAIKFGTNV
jgi:hypothetical protein